MWIEVDSYWAIRKFFAGTILVLELHPGPKSRQQSIFTSLALERERSVDSLGGI